MRSVKPMKVAKISYIIISALLCGADAKEEEARKLYEELKAECRRAEVIFIDGGQPVFDYVLVLE